MDVQMPGVDGLAATRIIREEEKSTGKHVAIVAMTAHALAQDRENCLKVGMDDYLSKPVEFSRLFSMIKRYTSPP
jgi:CheY-like chemotaxis protein